TYESDKTGFETVSNKTGLTMAKLKVKATFNNPKVVVVYVHEIRWKKKTKQPHLVGQTIATRLTVKDPWVAVVTTKAPKPGRKHTLRVVGLGMNGDCIASASIPVRAKPWP